MEKPEVDTIYAIVMDLIGEIGTRTILPQQTVVDLMDRIVETEKFFPVHIHPVRRKEE